MLVSRISTSIVRNRRLGNRNVCPAAVRDASPSEIVTGSAPSKLTRARVIQRSRGPFRGCTRLMRSVVIGSSSRTWRRSPSTGENAPTFHAVNVSPSRARAGRSSGVYEIGLPYDDARTERTPRSSTVLYASTPASGNTARRASVGSSTSGCSSAVSVYPVLSRTVLHRRARLRFESVTTSVASRSICAAQCRRAVGEGRRVEERPVGPGQQPGGSRGDDAFAVAREDHRPLGRRGPEDRGSPVDREDGDGRRRGLVRGCAEGLLVDAPGRDRRSRSRRSSARRAPPAGDRRAARASGSGRGCSGRSGGRCARARRPRSTRRANGAIPSDCSTPSCIWRSNAFSRSADAGEPQGISSRAT